MEIVQIHSVSNLDAIQENFSYWSKDVILKVVLKGQELFHSICPRLLTLKTFQGSLASGTVLPPTSEPIPVLTPQGPCHIYTKLCSGWAVIPVRHSKIALGNPCLPFQGLDPCCLTLHSYSLTRLATSPKVLRSDQRARPISPGWWTGMGNQVLTPSCQPAG